MSNLTRAIKVGCGFVLKLVDAPVQVVFKGCDHDPSSPDESWKAEVLAHAVDRLFHIHRTPVVCARALVARQGSTMAFIPAAVHVPALSVTQFDVSDSTDHNAEFLRL
jgi:hypothetical protein